MRNQCNGSYPSRSASGDNVGVRAESLRQMNLSVVLRQVLTEAGDITRAAISSNTGITRATISRLVDELIDCGFVLEIEPVAATGRGRPANRLIPAPGKAVALGLDIKVGSLSAIAVDLTGNVLAVAQINDDLAGSDPHATVERLGNMGRELLETHLPENAIFLGSGISLPGLVSEDSLALAPNLGWRDLPLSELLEPIADLNPQVVANEADLAGSAVATPKPGVPSGPGTFIYVSGDVGVGAGIFVNHQPLIGAAGWSGEIGHICVDPLGPTCSCGATGCLETFLGTRALGRRSGLGPQVPPQQILDAAHNGSITAQRALTEAGTALGRALSAVINSVDIHLVLLGGHVAQLSEALIEPATAEIRTRVLHSSWSNPQIQTLSDSSTLPVTGAAHRVLQQLVDDPLRWMDVEAD
ncbi:ROK family transcriptional regulator [Schaalia vaccimaxillae]|uniref:ROK family transcriptional regulator n=1 Tax=Schaalia vaccimaxillae TaxID=183916 RepID=UPI0003B59FB8|nr:ROK family transcriptional regulator [Schaalia vaccimaxillae]